MTAASGLRGRRVLIVGFRVTGQATARVLLGAGAGVVAIDDRPTDAIRSAAQVIGVELVTGAGTDGLEAIVAGVDTVVASPGVPAAHPVYGLALRHEVEVVSEIELATRLLDGRTGTRPVLAAVTGTNGKTTVTTQVCAALERSGRRAVVAGNIGPPLIEVLTADLAPEVVVAEVSSFQLQYTDRFRPDVSCWLNLAPDHLDWHPTLRHYRDAKARIWANQVPGDTIVVNADDGEVVAAAAGRPAGPRLVTFSSRHPADWFERDGMLVGPDDVAVIAVDELPRALPHDRANALATMAVASAAGATADGVRAALRETPPLPHRVELVGRAAGIAWYDDSKATTPASVLAATAGFGSVVLIAGGRNKGLDLSVLSSSSPPVHAVVAIGDAADEVAAAFAGAAEVTTATSMPDAVAAARRAARPGDAVILSPGCTSFDWYPTYAARGDHYASLVHRLLEKEEPQC